ncbi:MAG: hypothetical protein ACPG5U_12155 [Planktomarina sp.]
MAMTHEFYYSTTAENSDFRYDLVDRANPDAVCSDFLLHYFSDFFGWITCHNPARDMEPHQGLNSCGVSVLLFDAAAQLDNILAALIMLLEHAPEHLVLTGEFTWPDGDTVDDGYYEKRVVDPVEALNCLTDLRHLCTKVALNGEAFIIHHGL